MNAIELNNVKYVYQTQYQRVEALRGISYTFEPGKVYAIMGSSGCGKTTLLSLMAGLDVPTEGSVLREGVSTAEMDLEQYRRQRVAVIYQDFRLFPLLTAAENVMYPMELRGMKPAAARKRAAELIRKVGLPETVLDRFPAMLSGGEQQRVAIARAIAHKPQVIFADEPTGELDTNTGLQVVKIFKELTESEGVTIIMTTPDPGLMELGDAVYELEDGEIVNGN